ncbi:hypothetical protein [Cochlodiniinecator piscidefendens]|uniref:hypothetical protein n=1 Tax=Cochlodiniinecator piscidefendens TaxID=2715756 RepID=UPI001409EF69|nr:hypothetical protein [Cochlodiniinecator piscidefendens]
MTRLVRLYIQNVLIGFGLSAAFVAGLLYFDVAGLWHLISASSIGWIAVVMLFIGNGIIFAGVQFAWVIMRMAQDDDTGGGKTQREPALELVPVYAEENKVAGPQTQPWG